MTLSLKKCRSKIKHYFGPLHFGVLLVTVPLSLYYFGLVLSDLHSRHTSKISEEPQDQIIVLKNKPQLKNGLASLETPWDGLEDQLGQSEDLIESEKKPELMEEKIPSDPVQVTVTKPAIIFDFNGPVVKKELAVEPVLDNQDNSVENPATPVNTVVTVSKIKTTHLHNLIHETYGLDWRVPLVTNCTVDYINKNRLQQDHPCVIDAIRRLFLINPAPELPYYLDHPEVIHQSDQSKVVLQLLRYKTNGFFIECGASDGEKLSSTLFMERFFKWKGLLIEPNPQFFHKLLSRNRKSYVMPICLSPQSYPVSVTLNSTITPSDFVDHELTKDSFQSQDGVDYTIQCFPFYSVLLAINRNRIDFFRLNAPYGLEFQILKTIPWEMIDVTIISIGLKHIQEEELTNYMKKVGYVKLKQIDSDAFYIKNIVKKAN